MSSMIIPIGFGGGSGGAGGKPCIIVAGVTKADFAGKSVIVALGSTEIFNGTIPANVQSASFEIEEAGVYTITVGGTAYAVNVSTLNTNYMLIIGDDSTSRPPTVFKTAGTHSYTVPSGVKKLYITGAGGGGGGNYYAGGGGGDACFNKIITVTPGQTYTITVGSGGNGTTSQTGNGSSGGASKFGSLLTLAGGGGAQYTGSAPSGQTAAVPCTGAPGGFGGGGYYPSFNYSGTAAAYGSGIRLEYLRRNNNAENVYASATGNVFMNNSVGGGICAANIKYADYFPNGCGSLGTGARGITQDNYSALTHAASYGGGGCAKARYSDGSTFTSQSSVTTAYQKGATGCIIVSEEPISWEEMWGLLGEKFYSTPQGFANGSGYLIV